jgi:hypothetical protein
VKTKKDLEAEITQLKELVKLQQETIERLTTKPTIQFVPMPYPVPQLPPVIQPTIVPYSPPIWWGTTTCDGQLGTQTVGVFLDKFQ